MNHNQAIFARRLTTSAQVHPKILPYMHNHGPVVRGSSLRQLPAYAAAACIGYAVATYQHKQAEPPLAAKDTHLAEERLALLDAYGGRESLAELEKAANVYTSQKTVRR